MHVQVLTLEEIKNFKEELLEEIRRIIHPVSEQKKWLKSADVKKILNCSPGTLQNLRINGTLPFTKMGGTIYYDYKDVMEVLNKNKQNI